MSRDQAALMVSSGDEIGSYEQSPRKFISGTSKPTARPVAGPSKPASKRKKTPASDIVEILDHKTEVLETNAISSDGEDIQITKRGRAAAATNGRATSSKGKGKATATGKRKMVLDAGGAELVEDTTVETDADAFGRTDVINAATNHTVKNPGILQKQNERLQKQLKEVVSQRDSMSTQLEELFQLRHTEPESQLAEQKAQYMAYLKAKDDTIQELRSALSHVDKLSQSGTTTTLHFLTRESADEEKLDVQREVTRLKDSLKKRDETIRAKDVELIDLKETIRILSSDLKAEVEKTKELTSRSLHSPATKHSKTSDAKNALAILLYEELTNLLVTRVRHEPGKFREDDAIYTCVQTTSSGKTLSFELRFCKDTGEGESASNSKRGRVEKVVYTPLSLEKESEEFVQQLDFLARPFTFQEEQMSVFTKTILTYLEGEVEDSQSNTEHMEVEDD